jgi:hypothetical protein
MSACERIRPVRRRTGSADIVMIGRGIVTGVVRDLGGRWSGTPRGGDQSGRPASGATKTDGDGKHIVTASASAP